jgi:hypothetical protein
MYREAEIGNVLQKMKKENTLESKKNYNAPKMDVVELKHGANSLQLRTN